MKRFTALVAGVLCMLMVAGTAAAEDTEADLYGRQVDEAIEKAQKWLLDQQEKSGAWSEDKKFWGHRYESGVTAVVTYALLKSGISAQNDQLERSLAWMAEHPTDMTYELAFRVGCWAATHKQTQGKYRKRMHEDARKLVRGSYVGAYTYEVHKSATRYGEKKKKWDNSNSQYGLLGAWSYHRITNEVPLGYFRLVKKHWESCQTRNGGWPYKRNGKSSVTMTAAGLASLFVCYDNLYASSFVDCKGSNVYRRVEEGLKWFSENFQDVGKAKLYYHMYGIERVGLACGYKYFGKGKVDWYKWGVKELLDRQENDGSWESRGNHSGNDEVATSYALLFLIRGRSPVLFNKLEWNGDWNNRPRDLASVTRWIGDQYEREFAWQIIHVNAPVREWHDAQILYISAEKDPDFTDEEIAKLREFVDQGGTIFSVTECGGQGFRKGIRDAYKKMFPKLELTPMGPDHVIYNKVYSELKGQPKFYQMTNGLRPLVIHTDADLAKSWQLQLSGKGNERDFDAAANVYMYVTDLGEVRYRAVSHWPKEKKRSNYREVPVVRVKHEGDWNPEPLSLKRLGRLMSVHANTTLEIEPPVTIEKLASSKAKVAFLTGSGKLSLTDAEKKAIVAYVKGGGTLLVDAAGGDEDFAKSAARELESAVPNSYFVRLLANHDMYQLKDNKIAKIAFRPYRENFRPNRRPGPPRIKAINVDGRPAILLSDEDLTLGLLGVPSYTCDGYTPESAYELARNIVLYADKESGD